MKKLKLIHEDYPLTLLPGMILGGQVISSAFILTEITLTVWFCLKHRKSMTTLLKIALPLARKIQNDPKTIEHLVQRAGELVTTTVPPEPPPRPPVTTTISTVTTTKPATSAISSVTLLLLLLFPLLHHLELIDIHFITEAAQELYAKGQLRIKPYAGYLKEKHKRVQTTESDL